MRREATWSEVVGRREFLRAVAAVAALRARCAAAEPAGGAAVVDTQVYLGPWPLQQLPAEDGEGRAAELRRQSVSQAWVGSLEGLFHKDLDGVNRRLADACGRSPGLLVPFGTVNPTLPDWDEDVRRCAERYRVRGIRLHPNYHGYKLDAAAFAELLTIAAERKLIVQLVVRVLVEPARLLTPGQSTVSLAPLARVLRSLPRVPRLVVGGCTAEDVSLAALVRETGVMFGLSAIETAEQMRAFAARVPAERILFASGMPLGEVRTQVDAVHAAGFTAEEVRAIRGGNAERVLRAS